RRPGRAAYQVEPLGVVEIDLEPHKIERFQGAGQPKVAVDLVIEVGVEVEPDIGAGATPKGLQLGNGGRGDMTVGVELGGTRRVTGAGTVHGGLTLIKADQVGLQSL